MGNKKLGSKKILPLFFEYVVPGILGMIVLSLYGIIDGLFVGRTVGPIGIASMNLILPYLSIVMALSITITVGGTTYMGIEMGKGNLKETNRIFTQITMTMIVLGGLFALASYIFSGKIAYLLGATDLTYNYVNNYIRTISPFIIFYMLSILLDLVLRATGKPVFSMVALILSSLLNIVFDYIFVVKLLMGTKGAALATGCAFTMGAFVFMLPYLKKSYSIKLIKTKLDLKLIGKVLYNGSSEGLTEVAAAIVTFLFNLTLLKYLGEMGVSAYTVIGYISYISTAILIGISDGIKPIISYNYGAIKVKRIRDTIIISAIVAVFVGISTIITIDVFGEQIVNIFVEADKSFLDITLKGARIYTLAFLFSGFNIIASAYFTAMAKAKESMIVSLSRGLILIPLGLIVLPMLFNINGIWMAVPIAEVLTLIISIQLLRVSIKRNRIQ